MTDWLPEIPRFAQAAVLPKAFVVGCQKSGTTWLQHILAAHPGVVCRGEGCLGNFLAPLVAQAAKGYNERQRAGQVNAFTTPETVAMARAGALALFARWLDAEPDPDAVRLIAEKTPEHAIALPALESMFPGCRVVHIIRDGRDGVVSGWHHNLRENPESFRARFPDMAAYARYFAENHWLSYIAAARAFGARNPDRFLELRYETLLDEPESQVRRLLAFLGVDASDTSVGACVSGASFERLSGGRAPGQTDAKSHFRKGVAGDWREGLDPAALHAFEAAAGPTMAELGYEAATQAA
jgi:hypothetical protein